MRHAGQLGARTPAQDLAPAEILDAGALPRICLTGGEPLLQAEGVAELVAEAHRRGVRVHLETNGTVPPLGAAPTATRPLSTGWW